MTERETFFEVWDYLVVGIMLLVSGGIGVFFRFSGGRQKTTNEYLMGGRDMSILPVVLSLMATTQTAVGTLGFPGEVYQFGAGLYVYPIGFTFALILCTFIHTPVYFGIKITSAYEIFDGSNDKLIELSRKDSGFKQIFQYVIGFNMLASHRYKDSDAEILLICPSLLPSLGL